METAIKLAERTLSFSGILLSLLANTGSIKAGVLVEEITVTVWRKTALRQILGRYLGGRTDSQLIWQDSLDSLVEHFTLF